MEAIHAKEADMISTKRYFVNVDNGTIVPWTSEIESNYKFKEITVKVAMAVERGDVSVEDVIEQITKQIKPATLEQMLDAKIKMNVREGALNLEAQIKEDNTQNDTGVAVPYDVDIPADVPPKSEKPRKTARKSTEIPADEKVAAALGDTAGEPGGVNV